MDEQGQRRRRKLSMAAQVFLGLGLGVAVGVLFGEEVAFLKIGGDAFIALLQITIIPYVMVAVILSLGRLTIDDVKKLGTRAGSILLLLWAIGLLVILVSPLAFPDWPSSSFFSTSQIEEPKPVDFLQLYIPANLFFSLSNAIVPAIVVFSLLFGLALSEVGTKARLLDLLDPIADSLMGITGFVGKLAPYGVFALTAAAAGTIEVENLGRLQVYIVVYVALALLLSFWVLPGLITALTPLRYGAILRALRAPLITAFATGNVLIVLPFLAEQSKRLIAEADAVPDEAGERGESSVDVLVPAAFPFPSLGSVLALMFVLFGGWYMGTQVAVAAYPTLAFAGLASLFGGTVLALPFLFDLLRLPADLFQVFVTVDVIGSRFGTLLAAMHIAVIALVGTYALQGTLRLQPAKLLRFAALSVAFVGITLAGIRGFYTYVLVEPYTKDKMLAGLRLLEDPQPHRVFREPPAEIPPDGGDAQGLARLQSRGVLRACYMLEDYPSSFFNEDGDLVGFDIEMAHRFARHLDVPLEFLPVRSFAEARERLESSYCDVVMSLRPITPQLTKAFAITRPVLDVPAALIVRDHDRDAFQTWEQIGQRAGLRIGVLESSAARELMGRLMPAAVAVPYADRQSLRDLLEAGAPDVDAILVAAEKGAAWTILYPRFTLATPSPPLLIPFGYSVARGDEDLLRYLDTWLLNAKGDGTIDALYRYWMLGEVKAKQPPRWSVMRNVLGWID